MALGLPRYVVGSFHDASWDCRFTVAITQGGLPLCLGNDSMMEFGMYVSFYLTKWDIRLFETCCMASYGGGVCRTRRFHTEVYGEWGVSIF